MCKVSRHVLAFEYTSSNEDAIEDYLASSDRPYHMSNNYTRPFLMADFKAYPASAELGALEPDDVVLVLSSPKNYAVPPARHQGAVKVMHKDRLYMLGLHDALTSLKVIDTGYYK